MGAHEEKDRDLALAPTEVAARAESIDAALAAARPSDAPGLRLAQASVAAALFGSANAAGLGRFRVMERLGAGGMGVVYAAYDPDLDRGVALKLVPIRDRDKASALAEAKALARLSHPNVVPIFDVGVDGDHVYIVMELVRGETLGRWSKGRVQREILAAYRQAGEALSAAHAAGLIHRDFKPDNAIVGRDGRVRVVDFGLACEATPLEFAGGRSIIAGTPGYMAPEQIAGGPITAAVDQYSFAVSLEKALLQASGAPSTLPRWLASVIERGREADPAKRFSTMRELLTALGRDPARVLRRRILASAIVAVVVVAFIGGRTTLARQADACSEGDERLAASWAPGDREAAIAHLAALGEFGLATAPHVDQQLKEYAARWSGGYRDACRARERKIESDALSDRRLACLERGRTSWKSVGTLLATADTTSLPGAVSAVQALPEPDACADLTALLAEVAPPPTELAARVAALRARLDEARILIAAGRFEEARASAAATASDARALGYKPLVSEALLVNGHARMMMDGKREAVPALAEATAIGFEIGADALAVEAWARRAWAQGTGGEGRAALAGLDVVEAFATRPSSSRFARALLYNNVGGVELASDDRPRARAAFRRALDEAQGIAGPGAMELLNVRVNLGLTTDDAAERERLLAEAERAFRERLGDAHPDTLQTRRIRGMSAVPLARALEVLTPACERFEMHPGLSQRTADCWAEVAFLRRELDDPSAPAALQRAMRARPGESTPAVVRGYSLLWEGQSAASVTAFRSALAALPPPQAEAWWKRLPRADLELGLGRALRAAGSLDAAKGALETSVERLASLAKEQPLGAVLRRLARARAELAMTLAALGEKPDNVARVASLALASLREAGAPPSQITALERLPSKRP